MDVVNFLIEDQVMLRNELREIGRSLSDPSLYTKLKRHISNFDLYETVESNLFELSEKLPENEFLSAFVAGCKRTNARIWTLLDRFVEAVLSRRKFEIEQSYETLYEYVKLHTDRAQVLFPVLQGLIGKEVKQKLGEKALRYYVRFYEPLEESSDPDDYVTVSPYNGLYDRPQMVAAN